MRIAIVAPLAEAVPPTHYGGTERVVSLLTEELVRRGHDVTLFASGESATSARLVAGSSKALRSTRGVVDPLAYTIRQLAQVYGKKDQFDIIHNHIDYFAFPPAQLHRTPTVTTTHGRLDKSEVRAVYRAFPRQPLVAISNAQRASLDAVRWVATVYNSVDIDNYHFVPDAGRHLVFLGRISPEKRPDRAIEIARDVGMRLVMAAKVDRADQDYFDHAIRPLIRDRRLVEFVGEVDEATKDQLLGSAYAYLFPIDWPEPFGLTMAESMATGTPVVAYRVGSVPEVVEDGVTGFVCNSLGEMIAAVAGVGDLDRRACRERVERLFSPSVMTDAYEAVYESLAAKVLAGEEGFEPSIA